MIHWEQITHHKHLPYKKSRVNSNDAWTFNIIANDKIKTLP